MSKHKLLLADDSVTIQKVVNLTFADEGIEVISVGDGNTAMEKFVESRPDLVMVDVNMPGVDGYRICEIIKQDEETRDIPVILLVGSFEPFDEEEARRVGANDYLTKPFQSIRQLVNKVTVLLTRTNGLETTTETTDATGQTEFPEAQVPASIAETQEDADSPLGDTGMDDEMIQANQIGSLPVGDLQKFGLPEDTPENEPAAADVSGESFASTYQGSPDSLPTVSDDIPAELPPEEVREPDSEHVEETPSAEETGEITASDRPSISGQPDLSEEQVAYLEGQMVSEFESDKPEIPTGQEFTDDSNEMRLTSPEDYFAPGEISGENPPEVDEIPAEKGFVIEEIQDTPDIPLEEPVSEYQVMPEPEAFAPAEVFAEDAPPVAEEIAAEPQTFESPATEETELPADDADLAEPETVSQQPTIEEYAAPDQPVRPVFDEPQQETGQPPTFNEDASFAGREPAAPEERFAEPTPEAETGQSFYDDREKYDTGELDPVAPLAEAEPAAVAEDSFESAETVQFRMPSEETPDAGTGVEVKSETETGEETPEITAEDEKTHSKVNALVSNKDRTDAVESVIVSEFARQSISLSSEAVETIAARIAERISEKIIQEMAAEVVSDLADLIVERMERKRQQE